MLPPCYGRRCEQFRSLHADGLTSLLECFGLDFP
jgi:hypothetical protein